MAKLLVLCAVVAAALASEDVVREVRQIGYYPPYNGYTPQYYPAGNLGNSYVESSAEAGSSFQSNSGFGGSAQGYAGASANAYGQQRFGRSAYYPGNSYVHSTSNAGASFQSNNDFGGSTHSHADARATSTAGTQGRGPIPYNNF